MVSDHILKIVIEAEDRATAALERIEAIMKRLGLVGTESFNKASGGSTKFNESLLKNNAPLSQIQKHLKTVGVTGVQSFNQLSVSERKTLLEMDSLVKEAQDVKQRLNEMGVTGQNTWNQLSQSQQKALTTMDSLSQSANKVKENISNSTTSSKGKFSSLGTTAKEVGNIISGAMTKAGGAIKNKLGNSVTSAKSKLQSLGNAAENAGTGMGFLRSAASMTVGMIGYDLVNGIMEASRESINARGNFQAFGKRLGMSSSELKTFGSQCDKLQSSFKKVDMNAVGASALELGVKLGVPKDQMVDLTKMTAVMSSAFVKEGRTQEDAILAVSDAMDGQFKRLQEIGITQDKLKQNGWNGNLQDTESLMNAINQTMEDMGFTETASGIYTLDDAYQALTVSGGRLLGDILIPFTPIITGIIDGIVNLIGYIKDNGWIQAPIIIGFLVTAFILLKAAAIGAGTTILAMAAEAIPALLTNIPKAISGILALDTAFAPFFIIGAVIAAIAIAVYELGISFGWWTDVSSMLDAFYAGWLRISSAISENTEVQRALDMLKLAWSSLCEALKPVWDALSGVLDGFKDTNGEVNAVGGIIGVIIPIIESFAEVLRYVAYAIIWAVSACQQFYSALEYVWACIQNTISFFQWLYNCIVNIPTAAQNMITGIITWFSQLPGMVWGWIVSTATFILTGMLVWINYGKAKAQLFLNAVIGFVKTLPSKVFTYILNTASRITSGIGSWVSNARQGARNVVSAVVNGISSVPGKVAAEFGKIPEQIKSTLKTAVVNAFHGATALAEGVLNALGIHSPGIIQTSIKTEFQNTVGVITSKIKDAKNKATEFGSAILDGFHSNNMDELNVNPTVNSSINTSASLDTSSLDTGMNNTNRIISSGFHNMLLSEQTSMNGMVSDVNTNLGLIQNNEKLNMDTMTAHIDTSMSNILSKTKSGLTNTTNTTQTNLSKMQNSTAKTTSAMVKAWDSMKNNIVSAAKKIKTDSSSWFNSLSSTISSFYNKLQHPGGAGPRPAGGGTSVKRTTVGAGSPLTRLNSAVASKKFGIDIEYLGDNTTSSNVKGISITDLINSVMDGAGGAGSWLDVVKPNVSKIKNTARNWNMKGPKVWGKYPTGLSFKVKEFENGVPNINFSTFKGMAEDVFSQCNYDFYYNSEKYGSWQSAFSHGSMNCSDSSDALIWLARACGLPASKVHGHWNQFGHYWANIAGHKMDTTGWMQQRNWTPSASHAGPAPKSPFENLEESIDNLATDTHTGETFDIYTGEQVGPSELKITGEYTVIHKFEGLPDTVDEQTIVRLVNEAPQNWEFVKNLVENNNFQLADLKAKRRLDAKNRRARGV